ncbi:hypothetical protein HZA42_00045 [Candidatus Peregrinibacteria bacterium]|nr:hypothetical protein [Candidatus Peregrinibacteria bacterium]
MEDKVYMKTYDVIARTTHQVRGTKQSLLRFGRHNQGSALLIALMIMGVLMTLSLGVSSLVLGNMRDSRVLIERTKAWYAAESGLERALLETSKNPPGFETEKNGNMGIQGPEFSYSVKSTANKFPIENGYATLRLSESVTIPLFKGATDELTVKDFHVDYYLAPNISNLGGFISNDLDILRWKIFGIAADGTMEVINEFVPANKGNSEQSPTCFGTKPNCYNNANFYRRRLGGDGASEFHKEDIAIKTFLDEHKQNFLVLTNAVNTDMIVGGLTLSEKQRLANIKYRVIEDDSGKSNLTMPTIKISSNGTFGEAKQSLDLEIKRDTFLPVFNYALYRTAD